MKQKHKAKNKTLSMAKIKASTGASIPKRFGNIKGFRKR